nr:hypothetical protein GCM10020092_055990 [Actinoplanes digitatis]
MWMMRRGLALLPLVLLLLAVAEFAVFVAVVHAIGAFWALMIIIGSSIAGLALLRREGVRGWRAFREAAESGRPPGAQVSNSLVGLLGALLLAVPGFISAGSRPAAGAAAGPDLRPPRRRARHRAPGVVRGRR